MQTLHSLLALSSISSVLAPRSPPPPVMVVVGVGAVLPVVVVVARVPPAVGDMTVDDLGGTVGVQSLLRGMGTGWRVPAGVGIRGGGRFG